MTAGVVHMCQDKALGLGFKVCRLCDAYLDIVKNLCTKIPKE